MDLNFKNINGGTHVITDDVLIVGYNREVNMDATNSHDCQLIQVLNKCCEVSLKLNADKYIFKMMQVLFFGHLITSLGFKPDPGKIKAIANMPSSKTQLQSFIGLCNYLTCYVPHLTDVLSLLQALTVKSKEYHWTPVHTEAFKWAKQAISSACMLQYFNNQDPIIIQVDSSAVGVSAALLQQGKVVSYHI